MRHSLRLLVFALTLAAQGTTPIARADAGGYTFNRLVIWADPGDPPPRFRQDPETRAFVLLLPPPPPGSGWDPVSARRIVVHGGAFVEEAPISLLRPRDPDPDWESRGTSASLDLNRDGRAEVLRARNVVVPDNRDPEAGVRRVMVEIQEETRPLFGDLLEGPGRGPAEIHSVQATDFTGEGFADLVIRLESPGRTGIAFYSQAPLRYASAATQVIPGFSKAAFRCDRYGIFDLRTRPREFFARLPRSFRPVVPGCPTDPGPVGKDGHGRCRYRSARPYLGWIREFQVEFVPNVRLVSFDLVFPSSGPALTSEQALDFLTPVFGSGYAREDLSEGEEKRRTWTWKERGARARLLGLEAGGLERAVSFRLERD